MSEKVNIIVISGKYDVKNGDDYVNHNDDLMFLAYPSNVHHNVTIHRGEVDDVEDDRYSATFNAGSDIENYKTIFLKLRTNIDGNYYILTSTGISINDFLEGNVETDVTFDFADAAYYDDLTICDGAEANTLCREGCTDFTRPDYNPCSVKEIEGNCTGEIEGCMEVDALNYNPAAELPCGDCCEYPISDTTLIFDETHGDNGIDFDDRTIKIIINADNSYQITEFQFDLSYIILDNERIPVIDGPNNLNIEMVAEEIRETAQVYLRSPLSSVIGTFDGNLSDGEEYSIVLPYYDIVTKHSCITNISVKRVGRDDFVDIPTIFGGCVGIESIEKLKLMGDTGLDYKQKMKLHIGKNYMGFNTYNWVAECVEGFCSGGVNDGESCEGDGYTGQCPTSYSVTSELASPNDTMDYFLKQVSYDGIENSDIISSIFDPISNAGITWDEGSGNWESVGQFEGGFGGTSFGHGFEIIVNRLYNHNGTITSGECGDGEDNCYLIEEYDYELEGQFHKLHNFNQYNFESGEVDYESISGQGDVDVRQGSNFISVFSPCKEYQYAPINTITAFNDLVHDVETGTELMYHETEIVNQVDLDNDGIYDIWLGTLIRLYPMWGIWFTANSDLNKSVHYNMYYDRCGVCSEGDTNHIADSDIDDRFRGSTGEVQEDFECCLFPNKIITWYEELNPGDGYGRDWLSKLQICDDQVEPYTYTDGKNYYHTNVSDCPQNTIEDCLGNCVYDGEISAVYDMGGNCCMWGNIDNCGLCYGNSTVYYDGTQCNSQCGTQAGAIFVDVGIVEGFYNTTYNGYPESDYVDVSLTTSGEISDFSFGINAIKLNNLEFLESDGSPYTGAPFGLYNESDEDNGITTIVGLPSFDGVVINQGTYIIRLYIDGFWYSEDNNQVYFTLSNVNISTEVVCGQELCNITIGTVSGISAPGDCEEDDCDFWVYGCTDPLSNNYNPLASYDAGAQCPGSIDIDFEECDSLDEESCIQDYCLWDDEESSCLQFPFYCCDYGTGGGGGGIRIDCAGEMCSNTGMCPCINGDAEFSPPSGDCFGQTDNFYINNCGVCVAPDVSGFEGEWNGMDCRLDYDEIYGTPDPLSEFCFGDHIEDEHPFTGEDQCCKGFTVIDGGGDGGGSGCNPECEEGYFCYQDNCYPLGDVNLDGVVNILDVVILVNSILNPTVQRKTGINLNKTITKNEITKVLRSFGTTITTTGKTTVNLEDVKSILPKSQIVKTVHSRNSELTAYSMRDNGEEFIRDDCGICNYHEDGNNFFSECVIGIGPNEGYGQYLDCNCQCSGSAVIDDCGVCNGGNTDMDECGECFGSNDCADECGTIEGNEFNCENPENDCSCAGCTDPNAINYEDGTFINDGTCQYEDEQCTEFGCYDGWLQAGDCLGWCFGDGECNGTLTEDECLEECGETGISEFLPIEIDTAGSYLPYLPQMTLQAGAAICEPDEWEEFGTCTVIPKSQGEFQGPEYYGIHNDDPVSLETIIPYLETGAEISIRNSDGSPPYALVYQKPGSFDNIHPIIYDFTFSPFQITEEPIEGGWFNPTSFDYFNTSFTTPVFDPGIGFLFWIGLNGTLPLTLTYPLLIPDNE
tara:strand:- start:4418 stop:9193 length:4776 start_codon:yes stop_codon:yes gene_type:complete